MTCSPYQPLSAQDASFLFFERSAAHMHVAALATFEVGPLRSAAGGLDAARLGTTACNASIAVCFANLGTRETDSFGWRVVP